MRGSTYRVAALLATAALVTVPLAGTAQAEDPAPLYFRAGTFSCSIASDGTVGCDLGASAWLTMRVGQVDIPLPFQVTQVVIDVPWAPGHPGFAPGAYTMAGGNPSIDQVATGSDTWGPFVEHAGAKCAVGFHGSFSCTSKGHIFARYGSAMSAS